MKNPVTILVVVSVVLVAIGFFLYKKKQASGTDAIVIPASNGGTNNDIIDYFNSF